MSNINPYEIHGSSNTLSKSFMANVFLWMFVALGITAATAYYFGTRPELIQMLLKVKSDGSVGMSILGWVVMLAPFGMVMLMSFGLEKMKTSTMVALFVIYSVLMGMSLSFIFLAYTSASIFKTFIITSATFGIMAVVGYTTNIDLTKIGSILLMGLIGIIIASLVNVFMKSERLDFIISIIGVLIFTGLTAYDVQKLKQIGMAEIEDGETTKKLAIHGALSLYLDFINLFLYLLRFFGKRK